MELKRIENQIIRGKFTPLSLNKVDAVAFHHTANSKWDVKAVERYHVFTNGWTAIGYNYWIGFDGSIWEGRGLNVAAGISGHNSHVISVCLQGDFMTQTPTEAQYKACAEIYRYLKEKIPTIKKYARHCDYHATACPGKYFDLKNVEKFLKEEDEMTQEEKIYNWTTACPKWSQEYVHRALEKGLIQGDENGQLGLNDEKIWTLVVILRAMDLNEKEKGGD